MQQFDRRDVAGRRCEVVQHRAIHELAGIGVVTKLFGKGGPRPCTRPPRTWPSISFGLTGVPQSSTITNCSTSNSPVSLSTDTTAAAVPNEYAASGGSKDVRRYVTKR